MGWRVDMFVVQICPWHTSTQTRCLAKVQFDAQMFTIRPLETDCRSDKMPRNETSHVEISSWKQRRVDAGWNWNKQFETRHWHSTVIPRFKPPHFQARRGMSSR